MHADAIALIPQSSNRAPIHTTLLELVRALAEVTRDETELLTAVLDLLESGRVKPAGNFRDLPIALFRSACLARN
jgi:hypothetical protein